VLADAVADIIAFWNFKPSHARVWTLLYLRARPLDAATLQRALGLSKGSVSMSVRELVRWGVVHRAPPSDDGIARFLAETDFLGMIGRVVAEREGALVDRAACDIARAQALAREEGASVEAIERVQRMRQLAELVSVALRGFLATASLNVGPSRHVLDGQASTEDGERAV
jgi:DNA-binding transcriptional regulator GbsR (MarR family)